MKKTSEQWAKEKGIELGKDILDPDGWDRKNLQYSFYEEEIGFTEFEHRLMKSTCRMNHDDNKVKIGNYKLINK